jgi:hypothetical protein
LEADSRQKFRNRSKKVDLLVFGIVCKTAYWYVDN